MDTTQSQRRVCWEQALVTQGQPDLASSLVAELTAYQVGVWEGSLRWRTLLPFVPRLSLVR
jgi:hypothetical protein